MAWVPFASHIHKADRLLSRLDSMRRRPSALEEIANRMIRIFTRDPQSRRACFGQYRKFEEDPHWAIAQRQTRCRPAESVLLHERPKLCEHSPMVVAAR